MDSDIACPSSQSRSDCELQNKFANCRKNLLIFLHNVNVKNDLKVNFKVIKKYYKMSFDQFPESNEIMQIFEKITQRISLNKSQQKNWYQEDIMLLTWLIVKYSYFKLTDVKLLKDAEWSVISEIIPFKTADQCKFKWLSLERLNLQDKPWSIEEDQILKTLVLDNPNKKWTEIAKILYMKSGEVVYRAGKFCRERWNNYLTPDLNKGIWAIKEDIDLIEKVIRIGKKWSEISRITPGRTENGVKNRFNSLMKKWAKQHNFQSAIEEDLIISGVYKNLLNNQSKKEEGECQKNELEMSISRNQNMNKKVCHVEELRKKHEFNLLFELLKCDIGNANGMNNEKIKFCENVKQDLGNFEKMDEKKKKHLENEAVNLKMEEKEKEPNSFQINGNLTNSNCGVGMGMFQNNFGINQTINPWLMQQYMMNLMIQQTLTRNLMMNGLIKQENN